jgi:hypothetical protein
MTIKIAISHLFFLFFFQTSFAQNYTFKVLAIKGNITADNQALEKGSEVKSTQTITIVNDSSYIALYYVGKKEVIELTKKGVYSGQDLAKQISEAKGWESDFFYYTIGELAQEKTLIKDAGRKSVAPLMALLPTVPQRMYGKKLFFRWIVLDQLPLKDKIDNYQILIHSLQEKLLYLTSVKTRNVSLDLSSKKFTDEQILMIQIIPVDTKGKDLTTGFKNETYQIAQIEKEKAKEIDADLATIFKDRNRDTALSKLAEARYFEDKKLPLDAMQAFEQALLLSFNSEAYKRPYRFFLERYGYVSGTIDR